MPSLWDALTGSRESRMKKYKKKKDPIQVAPIEQKRDGDLPNLGKTINAIEKRRKYLRDL